jgi:hypothetical protein
LTSHARSQPASLSTLSSVAGSRPAGSGVR